MLKGKYGENAKQINFFFKYQLSFIRTSIFCFFRSFLLLYLFCYGLGLGFFIFVLGTYFSLGHGS